MFEIYKRGQGVRARAVAAGALGALAVFGCISLEGFLVRFTDATLESVCAKYLHWNVNLGLLNFSVSVMVSAVVFLLAAVLVALVSNHKKLVDYLISSETELRKVSWPTRADLKRQTLIVIATIFAFGVLLFVADLLFGFGSQKLYGL